MIETIQSVYLDKYCKENNIEKCDFVSMCVYNTDDNSYGAVYQTDKGLLFEKHKWVEVNKNKSVPKVCAEIGYTYKLVEDNFWEHFKKISPDQRGFLETIDGQKIIKYNAWDKSIAEIDESKPYEFKYWEDNINGYSIKLSQGNNICIGYYQNKKQWERYIIKIKKSLNI